MNERQEAPGSAGTGCPLGSLLTDVDRILPQTPSQSFYILGHVLRWFAGRSGANTSGMARAKLRVAPLGRGAPYVWHCGVCQRRLDRVRWPRNAAKCCSSLGDADWWAPQALTLMVGF